MKTPFTFEKAFLQTVVVFAIGPGYNITIYSRFETFSFDIYIFDISVFNISFYESKWRVGFVLDVFYVVVPQVRSLAMVTPKYFAWSVGLSTWLS